jgi:hypothetical protein
MKACELSFHLCAALSAATINHGGLKKLSVIAPFGMVKDIEKYIRTGEHPEHIKLEIENRRSWKDDML